MAEDWRRRLFATLGRIETRFDLVDVRFDTIDGRLAGIDGRLDTIDDRLEKVEAGLGSVDRRLKRLTSVAVTRRVHRELEQRVDDKDDDLAELREKVEKLWGEVFPSPPKT